MHTRVIAALCAAAAGGLMLLGVGTATAGKFSLSNQTIRLTFNDMEYRAGEIRNDCRVTFEGSFHARTFAKVEGSLVGYLTRVTTGQCTLGTTLLTETLPWHVRYQGFSGTLPEITLIIARIFGVSYRVSTCLGSNEIQLRAVRDPVTRALTGVEVPLASNRELPLTGILCPSPRIGALGSNGNGSVMVLGSSSAITVTLI